MQLRYAISLPSVDYVNEQAWQKASLPCCPRHPHGGCHFARHGTYSRVHPPGTKVARWYCPEAHQTFSLLPDCLAAQLSSTLPEVEAVLKQCEQASSREALADQLRVEIDLAGALRWIDRRCQPISSLLHTLKGLLPEHFSQCTPTLSDFRRVLQVSEVLMKLRELAERFLPQLPAPFGFAPRRRAVLAPRPRGQHSVGADPPAPMS